ncbi:septum formation family protein [Saccharopolyspora hordei]|uniref:Septum formation-related domain-containing protein n=1 Tax=Saccharopolyspora hordei TaxID=1838 RepID=A0A853ADN6_9PSEU|nr:septum formation family protein [Saccharopolyspora hordei]NYI81916.1 hypothetical protein [Saccharopolyspora hordei]
MKPNTRLVMICAVLGALLVLVVSALLNWPGDGAGGGGSDRPGSSPAPRVVFTAPPGSCLHWTEPDAADIRKVTCSEPHLFEVTGTADLRPQFGEDAPFPRTEQWQQIKQERCVEVSTSFLSGRFDPNGRFSVGAFTPSEDGWADGDRTLHCGLQQPGPSGRLYPMTGSASTVDQSNVYPEGRCLGINGTAVWDPVDCTKPHSVEITGVVDLSEQFPGGYPAEGDQDGFLATRCAELTDRYAGGPTVAKDKGLVTYWDTLAQESWDAGSRTVNCKVSAQLPDGSGLAPVTGSVKGEVRVGKEPAPLATTPRGPATKPR